LGPEVHLANVARDPAMVRIPGPPILRCVVRKVGGLVGTGSIIVRAATSTFWKFFTTDSSPSFVRQGGFTTGGYVGDPTGTYELTIPIEFGRGVGASPTFRFSLRSR
jgi:hypothetical protein